MQTEKFEPGGKRIMPKTRHTEFPAFFVDPSVGMQTEEFHPEGKRIMPKTRFTEFPAFFADPRVGISRSASETDD